MSAIQPNYFPPQPVAAPSEKPSSSQRLANLWALHHPGIRRATEVEVSAGAPQLGEIELAELTGRIVEVTGQRGQGCTSWLAHLIARAQKDGETTAWLQIAPGELFPPDLAAAGIDVRALAVGLLPDLKAQLRAADILLRSGGFGIVVLDLACAQPSVAAGSETRAARRPGDKSLGRLQGLCQKHGATLVLLTQPELTVANLRTKSGVRRLESLGLFEIEAISREQAVTNRSPVESTQWSSMISLRLSLKRRPPQPQGECPLRAKACKDKRRGPGYRFENSWLAPEGVF